MSNPYGWGQNEPQIKPKDQGGDTIATFSQKIYNLFDNLFNTLNSYPWSVATQSDAGYMSAADKTGLDALTNPTSFMPSFTSNIDTTQTNNFYGLRLGRLIVFTYWLYLKNATLTWNGNYILTNMPHATGTYQFPSCNADNLFLDGYTTVSNEGNVYYIGRSVSVPAGKGIRGWGCYLAAD